MKKNTVIYLFLIILSAFCLRLFNLGAKCLWFDEALDVYYVWTEGLLFPSVASISPAYSILLYFWKGVAGNEFMLRLPSAIFSLSSVYFIYLFASLVFNKKTGLISAFILAISPFSLYYAQECRPYSLSCLLVLLTSYFFVKCLKINRVVHWVCFIFFSLLGVYTHYVTFLIFFLADVFLLVNFKKYSYLRKRWYIANAVVLILALPAVKIIFSTPYLYTNWWVPSAGWHSIPITLKNFSIGYNAPLSLYSSAFFVFAFLFAYGAIKSRKNEFFWFFIDCLFLPLFAALLFSLLKPSYYIDRHLIPFSVFFYILAAYGASVIRRKYLFSFVLAGILAVSLIAIKNYYANYLPNSFIHHIGVQEEKDARKLSGYIMDNFKPGDALCFSDENAIPQLWYYLGPHYLRGTYNTGIFKELDKKIILEYDKKEDIILAFSFLKPSSPGCHKPVSFSLEGCNRIWLVACYNEKELVGALDRKFTRKSLVSFKGVRAYLFLVEQKL